MVPVGLLIVVVVDTCALQFAMNSFSCPSLPRGLRVVHYGTVTSHLIKDGKLDGGLAVLFGARFCHAPDRLRISLKLTLPPLPRLDVQDGIDPDSLALLG